MKYRPEIDGLRALAIVPVILFHAGFELFSGGFVGVDVFFVISGYLITSMIVEDIERKHFSIVNFYERRARRILPALFFVMLVCIPFAWMWMLPNQMKGFSKSLIAVCFFSSNILFWRETGYFDAVAEEKPLLHTWSLAVEEQYYLLFPIFLLLAWRFGKKRVFWMIIVMAAISLLLSEWGWRNKATANFYLAPTRAWELFAGSIAAFVVQNRGVQKNHVLSALGLAAIIFSIFTYNERTPFPSVYALVPVIGVVLLILYADKETLAARCLSAKAIVGIGLISYSAYLWHQPLFVFAKIRTYEPSESFLIVLSFMSFFLGYLSWRFVESPFRRSKSLSSNKFSLFTLLSVFFFAFIVIGISGYISDGFKVANSERIKWATLEEKTGANYGMSSTCEGEFTLSSDCATSQSPSVLLWGDSFAMHLYQGISASNPSLTIRQITTSSCSPILGVSRLNPLANKGYSWANSCIDFNEKTFEWLAGNSSVEFVVLSSPFDWVGKEEAIDENGVIHKPNMKFILGQFMRTIDRIKNLGVGVLVVSPTPTSGKDIGACLTKKHQFGHNINCDFDYSEDSYQHDFIDEVSNFSAVYWLYEDICVDTVCSAEIENAFIYRDTGHLSKEGSFFLGKQNRWYDKFRDLSAREFDYSE